MSKERISELHQELTALDRRIKPLEWDANRNQINDFRKSQLKQLQEKQGTLQEELNGLQQ
jgi:hypothetical protein